jgi:hypothetical protein
MLELIVGLLAVIAMAKVASADNQSPIIWGSVTLLLVIGCLFIPMPFLRVGLAFALAFVAMIGFKVATNR